MPETDGVKLARQIDARHVLFISGYDQEALVARGRILPAEAVQPRRPRADRSRVARPRARNTHRGRVETLGCVRSAFRQMAAEEIAGPRYRLARMLAPRIPTDLARFAIGFDQRDRARLHALWERCFDSERWSEGALTAEFEAAWAALERRRRRWRPTAGRARRSRRSNAPASAARRCSARRTRSWRLRSPRSAAGARVEFVDCNRDDLCMSFDDLEREGARAPAAGGVPRPHRRPPRFRLRPHRRALPERGNLPDRGLRARARRRLERPPRRARWGDAGIWSFAATKTISTGEGGMLVSAPRGPASSSRARSATTASPTTRCTA